MRKIIALTGFILIMFGIWGWSIGMIGESELFAAPSFFVLIIGITVTIIGAITHPKELKEPFKKIAEKFEKMNKPLLIASILIFFISLWLLFYGFIGINFHNYAAAYSYFLPVENA